MFDLFVYPNFYITQNVCEILESLKTKELGKDLWKSYMSVENESSPLEEW